MTTEDNQQQKLMASMPQEKPRSKPAGPSDAAHQPEPESTARQAEKTGQPAPPRNPGIPVTTRILPERQTPDAAAQAAQTPGKAAPADPAARLTDLGWMPPAEDQVARFLNDVADIAPPTSRGREGDRAPTFMAPATTSPEAAKRKKAKAEPFWSQVVATPMELPAHPPRSRGSRRGRQNRSRPLLRWLMVAGIILLLVIGALAVLVLTHHVLLDGSVHLQSR